METNPFMIDVVLSTLFEKLPINSLTASRLVCHQWYSLATPHLQNRMLKKANNVLQLHFENWTYFLDTIGKTGVFWRKLVLTAVPINQLCSTPFIHNYGPRLTSLSLVNYYQASPTINDFRHLLSLLPNLQKLSLGALPKEISAYSGELFQPQIIFPHLKKLQFILKSLAYTPNFFHGLFQSAPNLDSLNVSDVNSNFGLVTLILQLIQEHHVQKLSSLKISQLCEQNLFMLNNFSDRGLILKKLHLESLTPEVVHSTVSNLLTKQSKSLEKLMIGRPSACRSVFLNFNFPFIMPNLKKLDFWTHSLDFATIQYSRQLPSLNNIIVRGYRSYHNWSVPHLSDPNNLVRCESVKSLTWIDSQSTDVQVNLWKIYLIFPVIKKVRLNVYDPNTLHTLWTMWTGVEDLEILLDAETQYLDSAFTGISPDTCVEIHNNNTFHLVNTIQTQSSIGTLSNLRRLRIFQNPGSSMFGDNILTDITGYFIYERLINLEELVINRSMISERCRSTLAQLPKINSLKITAIV